MLGRNLLSVKVIILVKMYEFLHYWPLLSVADPGWCGHWVWAGVKHR